MTTSRPGPPTARELRFRAVFEATYDDVLRFAQRRVDPSHAEDVAADVFLVAWRRLDDMPDGGDARPWLFGVARATMLNHRRGERRRDALAVRIADASALTGLDGSALTHDVGELAAARLDLASAWARLSAAEQEAIGLSVWEGLDARGAGAVLGCSATAYRLRLSRARRSLRRHLEAAVPAASDLPQRSTTTTPEGTP
jgi:RNA polymerase sigma-70 factor (ECF subfamily)